jgi:hypothetical protein
MASLGYVVEFADWPQQKNLVIAKWSSRVVEQTPIDFTAGHAESSAFAATTRYILFTANVRFAWTIGSSPTATTSKTPFPADQPYHIEVQPGDKISFVASP